ncbi:Membrane bound O-acyl transferase family [Rhizoctonia solani]|uniref:Membrane bound O-acyl transferase family n=1 Tax=Rhizoctonia solani TaxID=456999 RepID=A0A8H7M550_9AGAM|nr:Membrane bound O-acyl transferase family [Rhizoctonia solani]
MHSLVDAFRILVPEPKDRIPLTWSNSPLVILPVVPLLLLSYLARRPRTQLLRLAILPLAVWSTLSAAYTYEWTNPVYNVYNFASGLWGMFALLKAVEFALTPHGRLKVGEMKPGSIKSPASNKYIANFTKTQSISRSLSALYIGFLDACELLSSMRGVGWDYGTGNDIYIPLEHRSSEKTVVSTGLHFATGVAFIAGFNMFYGLLTLIAVSWWQPPSAWPPVTENPWATTSLHDFWGKRWHQLLRQAFFVGGGYPLAFLGKTIFGVLFGERVGRTAALWGLLLGTFTASGLFHMFAMYAMGQGIEWKVVGFFSAQAIALILERAGEPLPAGG